MNTDTDRLEFMLRYEAEVWGHDGKYNCAWCDGVGNTCRTPEDVIYTTPREAIDAAIQVATNEVIDATMDRLKTKGATPEPVKESKINTEQVFSPSIEATDNISLRDQIALAVLISDLKRNKVSHFYSSHRSLTEKCYAIANAMMAARKQ